MEVLGVFAFVLVLWLLAQSTRLTKTTDEQQKQIDKLKRKLEELERKQ